MTAVAAVATVLACFAPGASAATPIVPRDSGLTLLGGIALTPPTEPGGEPGIWVADELHGLCRVAPTPDPDAGNPATRHGRLMLDAFCAPEPPEPPPGTPPPDPRAATRPSGAFQIAFDHARCAIAASGCNFYVAEGTSGGSGVWRMHWDPVSGTIDAAAKIYSETQDLRVTGLALTPAGDVDFSTKRDAIIRRLVDPANAEPFSYRNPPAVGQSAAPGVASLTYLGPALYLADAGTVTRIADPKPTGNTGGTAVPVPGAPSGVSAVAADPGKGVVYAGTNTGLLTDAVHAVTDGGSSEYDAGFANVTAMGVDADGTLYTADDAAEAAGVVETAGHAQLFRTPKSYESYPHVSLVAAPPSPTNGTSGAGLRIAFASLPGVTFGCQFGQETLADVPCDAGEYTPSGLADGAYRLTVRATDAAHGTGPPLTVGFELDTTGPTLSLDPNAAATAVGGDIGIAFSANQVGTTFECRLDGGAFEPCSSPKRYGGLALGAHTFEVTGRDAAGNAAVNTLTWDFTSVPAPPAPQPEPVAPAALVPASPAPLLATTPRAAVPAAATVVQASARVPAQAIGVPCVAVSRALERARFRLDGADAVVRFRPPPQARWAKFTLRRAGAGRRGARIAETVAYATVRAAGARHTTRIALTRAQRSKVRAGHLRLAVAYGTCRTRVGRWDWMTTSTQGGARR